LDSHDLSLQQFGLDRRPRVPGGSWQFGGCSGLVEEAHEIQGLKNELSDDTPFRINGAELFEAT
jgi:hypothetical protein